MIAQPDEVTAADVSKAKAELREKKDSPGLARLKFKRFAEGKAVQIMHIGPYSAEGPTIEKLHRFSKENGFRLTGKHSDAGEPRHCLGTLGPGESKPATIVYQIPQGVSSFRALTYVTCVDVTGARYYFPEAPPTSDGHLALSG